MACKVHVLKAGYARVLPDCQSMAASGSATLVRTNGTNILVDCLGPWDSAELIQLLAKEGLHPDDVHHLVCTHGHPDHIGNLNLFTKAKSQIVGQCMFERNVYKLDCPFEGDSVYAIEQGIDVISTPGHTASCISVVVHNAAGLGDVVIAGDLFESQEDLDDEKVWLEAGSENPELQRINRAKVLALADFIVPGHGPMFKVNK